MKTGHVGIISCLTVIMGMVSGCHRSEGNLHIGENSHKEVVWFDLDVTQWIRTPLEEDPLVRHRPAIDSCDGWWIEEGLLEVSTQACHYFSMSYTMRSLEKVSPIPIEILLGNSLIIKGGVIHDFLSNRSAEGIEQPSSAHIALLVGQEIYWEQEMPIPSPSNYVSFELNVPPFVAEEATVNVFTIHLHNHGANQWRWLPLQVGFLPH